MSVRVSSFTRSSRVCRRLLHPELMAVGPNRRARVQMNLTLGIILLTPRLSPWCDRHASLQVKMILEIKPLTRRLNLRRNGNSRLKPKNGCPLTFTLPRRFSSNDGVWAGKAHALDRERAQRDRFGWSLRPGAVRHDRCDL